MLIGPPRALLEVVERARRTWAAAVPAQHLAERLTEQLPTIRVPNTLRDNPAILEAADRLAALVQRHHDSTDAYQRFAPDTLTLTQPSPFETTTASMGQALDAGIAVATTESLRREIAQVEAWRASIEAPVERFVRELRQRSETPLPPLPPMDAFVTLRYRVAPSLEAAQQVLRTIEALRVPFSFPQPLGDEVIRDLFAACRGDEAAHERIARWVVSEWKLYKDNPDDRAVQAAILARAEEEGISPQEVRRAEILAALIVALATRTTPQRIRFGNIPLNGGAPVIPMALPLPAFRRWLRQRTIAEARKHLLGDTSLTIVRSTASIDVRAERGSLVVDGTCPEELAGAVAGEALREIWAGASPKERELLPYLATGFEPNDIARQLGKAPGTIRKQVFDLRRRFQYLKPMRLNAKGRHPHTS